MTPVRRCDLVIFDLDGTLVDSLPDIAWSLNDTLVGAGIPALPVSTVRSLVGDGAAKLIARAWQVTHPPAPQHSACTDTENQERLLARFMATYATRICVDSRLYPGVTELLDALASVGMAAAVVTNKPGPLARQLLSALNIADRFTTITGDLDGFPRKPDPTAAHAAMKAANISPSRAIIVGDGLPDMRLAHAIPCPSVAAGWGYLPLEQLQKEHPTHTAPTVAAAAQILLDR